jgi:hypothetical protein
LIAVKVLSVLRGNSRRNQVLIELSKNNRRCNYPVNRSTSQQNSVAVQGSVCTSQQNSAAVQGSVCTSQQNSAAVQGSVCTSQQNSAAVQGSVYPHTVNRSNIQLSFGRIAFLAYAFGLNVSKVRFCSRKGNYWVHALAQLVEPLREKPKGRGFDYLWCHYGRGVDSASNRN